MRNTCKKCGNSILLMTGYVRAEPDEEPYESGKKEKPRTGIKEINKPIIVEFCENCDEIADTFNE